MNEETDFKSTTSVLDPKKEVQALATPSTLAEDNEEDHDDENGSSNMHRTYGSALLSGCFFIAASALYIVLAAADLQYFDKVEDYTDDELSADDVVFWNNFYWETDFLFSGDIWVSRSMVVYFLAALCFVVVGVIDWLYKPGCILGLTFVLAGLSGLVAAMLYDYDIWLSNIFDAISVHLFFAEAIEILYYDWKNPGSFDGISLAGDGMFLTGSFIDVVLSYPALFETFDSTHAIIATLASALWLGAALVNMYSVISERKLYAMQEHTKDATTKEAKQGNTSDGEDSKPSSAKESSSDDEEKAFVYEQVEV